MKRAFALIFFLTFVVGKAHVYSVPTHEGISEKVVEKSMLWTVPELGEDLGLRFSVSGKKEFFPDSKGTDRTIIDLIVKGSAFEDDLPRPINHAYDSLNGKGFRWESLTLGNPSPDWALEDHGESTDPWHRS